MRTHWRKINYLGQAAFLLHCIRVRRRRLIEHKQHQAALQLLPDQQTDYQFPAQSELPSLALTNTLTSPNQHLGLSRVFSSFKKPSFLVLVQSRHPYWPISTGACSTFSTICILFALVASLADLRDHQQHRGRTFGVVAPELGMIFKIFPTRQALLDEAAFVTSVSSKDISVPKVVGTFSGMLHLLVEEWARETIPSLESISPASRESSVAARAMSC